MCELGSQCKRAPLARMLVGAAGVAAEAGASPTQQQMYYAPSALNWSSSVPPLHAQALSLRMCVRGGGGRGNMHSLSAIPCPL